MLGGNLGGNMSLNDIKLEIGKSYNIDYVIRELEKTPEVQLGHIIVAMTREHKYHVNKLQLEELARNMKRKIDEGGKEYEKVGKKFVPLTDITILSIIDPYTKYEKYNKFYTSLEPEIIKGIEESKKESVAAPTDAIINEARKLGIVIENEGEFLDGMGMFFRRRNITTNPISAGKYILFEKYKTTSPRRLAVVDTKAAEIEYEKYRFYTKFYDVFFKQIIEDLTTRKKGEVAASIDAIANEAQKMGFKIESREKDFLTGMDLYFKIRGIRTEKVDRKYLVFKRTY